MNLQAMQDAVEDAVEQAGAEGRIGKMHDRVRAALRCH